MDPTELLRHRLHRLGHAQSGRQLGPRQQQQVGQQPDTVFQLQPLTALGSRADAGANTSHSSEQATAPQGKVYARSKDGAKAAAGAQDLRAWLPLGGSKLQHRGVDMAATGKENSSCLLALNHTSSAAANNKRLQQLKLSAMTEEKQMRTEDRFPLATIDPNRPPAWASAHKKASSRLSHSLSMSDGKPTAPAANTAAAKGGGLRAWDILTDSPLSVRQLSQEEEQPAAPRARLSSSSSPPLLRAPAPTPTASPSQSSDEVQSEEDVMDTSSSNGGAADAADPSWEAGGGSGSEQEGASMSTSSSNSGGGGAAASMEASPGDVQWGGQPSSRGLGGSKQQAQKKRRAADALPHLAPLGPGRHQVAAAAGNTQRTKAAKARHPAADKPLTAAQLPEGHVPLQLPSAALVHAAKMVLLEMPAQFDVSGDMGAVGRLERAGPALEEQVSLEDAAATAAAAAGGGAGGAGGAGGGGGGGGAHAGVGARASRGLEPQGYGAGAQPVHLDLKGVLYDLEHLPLAGSCAVVKMGGHGGAAQVEHLFQSFVRAQPQQDPQDTAGGAYLHYDSSADEAGPAGTGAGAAEGKGVGGGGSKAQRGRGGRGGGGRGRGASKTGAGRPRAAGGVRKRGGGGSKAPAARQQQMAAAAAAAQVVGGASKAAAGGRGAAQGSDSDDDYQPSS